MSKRLQVLLDEDTYREVEQLARRGRMTVSDRPSKRSSASSTRRILSFDPHFDAVPGCERIGG